jgi:2-polyprenyl-6-methoxyphenol hydroxylase-like FAD-dependent oxidoreductase
MSATANDLVSDVVVVGAGPVGLWLAAELALAGIDVVVLEKREERSPHSRALTVHARTLETFALRGIADWWLDEGIAVQSTHYALLSSRLDLTNLPSKYPFTLSIPQRRTEELIEQHALRVGVRIERGFEVKSLNETFEGVTALGVDRAAKTTVRVRGKYVVGCDGRRSVVRPAAGIDYHGTEDSLTCVIGDVELTDTSLAPSVSLSTEHGSAYIIRIAPDRSRVIAISHATMDTPRDAPVSFEELRDALRHVVGTDYGMCNPSWLTRIGSSTYQADSYRQSRYFLAGDAAHVHFPMGGQGMNLGIQDAMNLGWKLAAALRGSAGDALLDSYHAERWPVGHRVVQDTLSQTALVVCPGREGVALRTMFADALATNPDLNSAFARFASGISVSYPEVSAGHPLTGERVPDLAMSDGSSLFDHMASGQPLVIGADPHQSHQLEALVGHPNVTQARPVSPDQWGELSAAVIRPDGYLAWGSSDPEGIAAIADGMRALFALAPPS